MDVVDHEVIPQGNAGNQDFADDLPPGYRFRPTDLELIVNYLDAKINSRIKLPPCRLHEVNIYNHKPEELTRQYRSHDDEWYFLTPTDRRWTKGVRVARTVRDFGVWKLDQKVKKVYADATEKVLVGYKGSLTYWEKGEKTFWVMREYTNHGPDLPPIDDGNKLNDLVLCKIYKNPKEIAKTKSTHGAESVGNNTNPGEVIEAPAGNHVNASNGLQFADGASSFGSVEPPFAHPTEAYGRRSLPKRRRVSKRKFPNHREHFEVQETNRHLGINVEMVAPVETERLVNDFDMSGPGPSGPLITAPMDQSAHTWVNQNQFTSNAINTGYQFSLSTVCKGTLFPNGAFNLLDHGGNTAILTQTQFNYEDFQKSYQDSKTLLDMQNGWTHQSMVTPQDVADHFTQPDAGTSASDDGDMIEKFLLENFLLTEKNTQDVITEFY